MNSRSLDVIESNGRHGDCRQAQSSNRFASAAVMFLGRSFFALQI